jgi:hypothetical protein
LSTISDQLLKLFWVRILLTETTKRFGVNNLGHDLGAVS